mmetsp:Transcript_4277/g.6212  ORF Transcript_4277/g.6212 Transcript_4277/m.6212 type:complete len:583 (+) Transcript_4277:983-2731(+)
MMRCNNSFYTKWRGNVGDIAINEFNQALVGTYNKESVSVWVSDLEEYLSSGSINDQEVVNKASNRTSPQQKEYSFGAAANQDIIPSPNAGKIVLNLQPLKPRMSVNTINIHNQQNNMQSNQLGEFPTITHDSVILVQPTPNRKLLTLKPEKKIPAIQRHASETNTTTYETNGTKKSPTIDHAINYSKDKNLHLDPLPNQGYSNQQSAPPLWRHRVQNKETLHSPVSKNDQQQKVSEEVPCSLSSLYKRKEQPMQSEHEDITASDEQTSCKNEAVSTNTRPSSHGPLRKDTDLESNEIPRRPYSASQLLHSKSSISVGRSMNKIIIAKEDKPKYTADDVLRDRGTTGEELLRNVSLSHHVYIHSIVWRLDQIQKIKEHWNRGDVNTCVKRCANLDCPDGGSQTERMEVVADFLRAADFRCSSFMTLNIAAQMIPILTEMLLVVEKITDEGGCGKILQVTCERRRMEKRRQSIAGTVIPLISDFVEAFTSIVKATVQSVEATDSLCGIDIVTEDRQRKCTICHENFLRLLNSMDNCGTPNSTLKSNQTERLPFKDFIDCNDSRAVENARRLKKLLDLYGRDSQL